MNIPLLHIDELNLHRFLKLFLSFIFVLVIGCTQSFLTFAQDSENPPQKSVVRAVLFWMEGCPACKAVLDETLPELQTRFPDQLEILRVELKTAGDIDQLYKIGLTLGLTKEEVVLPFLVIDNQALVGADQISENLPKLINQYIASGGVDYPAIPSLRELFRSALDTQAEPVVNLLLYWTGDCHACQLVLDDVLPSLKSRYGNQIVIQIIDLVTGTEVEQFYEVAESFGIPQNEAKLPMIIIGEHVLIGAEQIPTELPGIVELYHARGGVALPDLSRVELIEPANLPGDPPSSIGFWSAIVIMIGMIAALLYSLAMLIQGKAPAVPGRWMQISLPVVALIGLGVAGYLAYVETQSISAVCGPVGDCNAVQNSPYARLFGLLPIGILGVIGYLFILIAWLYQQVLDDHLARNLPLLIFFMSFCGVLFSLYLTYLEPFVIKAVCVWCLASAVIMTLLMLLSLKPALQLLSHNRVKDPPNAET